MLEILTVVAAMAAQGAVDAHPPDWSAVLAATRTYREEMSDENAERLYRLIPTRQLPESQRPNEATAEALDRLVPDLERQMYYGQTWATRLAFRLRHVSDAAFSEDLDSSLSTLATNRPELFVRELRLDGGTCEPVRWFSPDYDEQWMKRERALRLARLSQPLSSELEPKRRECLRMLQSDR